MNRRRIAILLLLLLVGICTAVVQASTGESPPYKSRTTTKLSKEQVTIVTESIRNNLNKHYAIDTTFKYSIQLFDADVEVLKEVFPQCEFYVAQAGVTLPPKKILVAVYNSTILNLPEDFNKLLRASNIALDDQNALLYAKAFIASTNPYSQHGIRFNMAKLKEIVHNNVSFQVQADSWSKINGVSRRWLFRIINGQFSVIRSEVLDVKVGDYIFDEEAPLPSKGAVRYYYPELSQTAKILQLPTVAVNPTSVVIEEDQNPTPVAQRTITITISDFDPNVDVQISITSEHNGITRNITTDPVTPFTLHTDASGGGSQAFVIDGNSATGICQVLATRTGQQAQTDLIVEKIRTESFRAGYNVTLFYASQFFDFDEARAEDFATEVMNATLSSYNTEVSAWGFQEPPDADNTYVVVVHDGAAMYHGSNNTEAFPGNNRLIGIQSNIHARFPAYSSESIIVQSAIFHEFYHGIEWGYNQWKNGDNDWDYYVEGQARFIQSVAFPDEEYQLGRLYPFNANSYLTAQLNQPLTSLSYDYCLYWRFLYERYDGGDADNDGDVDTRDNLTIIRNCYAQTNSVGNDAIVDGETAMNNALTAGGGAFRNFDQSIVSFANAIALIDEQYDVWDQDEVYSDPHVEHTENFVGSSITIDDQIPVAFGIDLNIINFNDPNHNTGTIRFDGDPDNDGVFPDFHVSIILFDNNGHYREFEVPLDRSTKEGIFDVWGTFQQVETRNAVRATVVVTRLDTDESLSDTDYRISITEPRIVYFSNGGTIVQQDISGISYGSTGSDVTDELVLDGLVFSEAQRDIIDRIIAAELLLDIEDVDNITEGIVRTNDGIEVSNIPITGSNERKLVKVDVPPHLLVLNNGMTPLKLVHPGWFGHFRVYSATLRLAYIRNGTENSGPLTEQIDGGWQFPISGVPGSTNGWSWTYDQGSPEHVTTSVEATAGMTNEIKSIKTARLVVTAKGIGDNEVTLKVNGAIAGTIPLTGSDADKISSVPLSIPINLFYVGVTNTLRLEVSSGNEFYLYHWALTTDYERQVRFTVAGTISGSNGGVKGTRVNLLDQANAIYATTAPDNGGLYQIQNVPNGNYTVQFVIPPSYAPVTAQSVPITVAGADVTVDFELSCKSDIVSKGICWLRNNYSTEGTTRIYWRSWNSSPSYGNVGITSLTVLSQKIAGYDKSDPIVRNALNYITSRSRGVNGPISSEVNPNTRTYETSMALLALDAFNLDGEFNQIIESGRNYLTSGRNSDGGWRYYANYGYSDLSVTQWPALALHALDYDDLTVWNGTRNFAYSRQTANGEFLYGIGYGQGGGGITAAGLWVLLLHPQVDKTESHITNGFNWLNSNYNITCNPGYTHGGCNEYYFYYLYSLAKACQLREQKLLGTHDWYSDISSRLISLQYADGHWQWGSGTEGSGALATAFALLSLQVNVVPPNSKVVLAVHSPMDLHVYDPSGRHTGYDYSTGTPVVKTNIPNSTFEVTGDGGQVITIDPFTEAGRYTYQLLSTGSGPYTFTITTYQNDQQINQYSYTGSIAFGQNVGGTADINAIEGQLNIFTSDPSNLPTMALSPDHFTFWGEPSKVFVDSFLISETSGQVTLRDISIYSNDLSDGQGNIIPKANITVSPAFINNIPAGQQAKVRLTASVPANTPRGIYTGPISISTLNAGTKAVMLTIQIGIPDTVKTVVIPSLWYGTWVNSTLGTVRAYIGNMPSGYTVNSITPSSIKLNETVPIYGGKYRIISSMPGFMSAVMEVTFSRQLAVQSLKEPVHDSIYTIIISGDLNDGKKFVAPFNIILVGPLLKSSEMSEIAAIPADFRISQNYPNPFNPETDIEYALPVDCQVKLTIYNLLGQKVKTLVNEPQTAGYKTVHWNGRDEQGNLVSSGIYFYKLQAGDFTDTKKMVMTK